MFESRYITKDDYSFDGIPLSPGIYWVFSKLQKEKGRSWHSRPYEYAFVVRGILKAYLLDMIKLDKVLDMACGANHPGYMAIANIAEVEAVIALDIDDGLIRNGMDHPKVTKFIRDATNTGFTSERFDTISCVSAFEHMVDWRDCVWEMYRLLKPKGMAFVTFDISIDVTKTAKHGVDDKTPDDYKKGFEDAGFKIAGRYNGDLPNDAIDAICSKYPIANSESELLDGQHNALKTFKMVLIK